MRQTKGIKNRALPHPQAQNDTTIRARFPLSPSTDLTLSSSILADRRPYFSHGGALGPIRSTTHPRIDQPLVLVVDDEPALRDAIAYSLRREGWRVALATDGLEALRLNGELQPDLIVLDVMLPGLDGIQVCRSIRARSDVPVLFLSAKGEDVDRILGLEIGGDDYLTKPFVMRELVARVRANLRRTQRGPTQRSPEPVTPVASFHPGRGASDHSKSIQRRTPCGSMARRSRSNRRNSTCCSISWSVRMSTLSREALLAACLEIRAQRRHPHRRRARPRTAPENRSPTHRIPSCSKPCAATATG